MIYLHVAYRGTDGYLTPESCLRLEPVGRHDDVRGVCATLYEFWAGHKVSDMLRAAFASLPPAIKKLVRQWCRSKGIGSTHDVWVAAAEHLGHIGIQTVRIRCTTKFTCCVGVQNHLSRRLHVVVGAVHLHLRRLPCHLSGVPLVLRRWRIGGRICRRTCWTWCCWASGSPRSYPCTP